MKLQDNFTTEHQSKRLLKLGVPANSADCYFTESGKIEIKNTALDILYTPCWSVGRLIKILKQCILDERCLREIFEELEMCVDEVKSLVQAFYDYGNVINFSKLEE